VNDIKIEVPRDLSGYGHGRVALRVSDNTVNLEAWAPGEGHVEVMMGAKAAKELGAALTKAAKTAGRGRKK
jgi:hypothetical protein